MNWLDAVLLLLLAVYAYAGWAHGFVANVFSAGGLFLGFLLGIALVPKVFGGDRAGDTSTALMSIAVVFAVAGAGNLIGSIIGRRLRVERGPARAVDAVLGMAFGTAVVMATAWAIGYALTASSLPYLSAATRQSQVLALVDRVMPIQARETLQAFTDTLTGDVFPRYIDPFDPEVIADTPPPDARTLAMPGVRAARSSVVRVLGDAVCQRRIEGSGFVYAPGRVMTNAHVIAGVDAPTVTVGGRTYDAQPVVFDADLDLAVLAVPGLRAAALRFDTGGEDGDPAAILGYPQNGPFDARPARIRDRINLRGPDIRGDGRVERDVFSVRGLVRSGNSGGPLMSPDGQVLGIIFAASLSDDQTGYAVTAGQARATARLGQTADDTVSTGGCV